MKNHAKPANELNSNAQQNRELQAGEVRDAVQRLKAFEGLSGSRRLKGFLDYVVAETLEGRGDAIRAKTLAIDVYHYQASDVVHRENVIRVDAGRLRRRMNDYYNGAGQSDPIEITLPKGSYTPEFKRRSNQEPDTKAANPKPASAYLIGVTAGIGTILLLSTLWFWSERTPPEQLPGRLDNSGQKRTAIFESSPSRLQAINLAQEGRDLIFPAVDPNRLKAALLVFESAISLDGTYFGGFAGAAQIHALIALLTPDPVLADAAMSVAQERADQAAALSPESAWSQSALAMVEFSRRNWDQAKMLSERAINLDPDDPHLVEFDALISLFSGDFGRVLDVVGEAMKADAGESGFVFQNALGSTKYHMGDYEGTIRTFEEAIASGAPSGPASVAYLMAAHYRLGDKAKARELAQKYRDLWPENPIEKLFRRLFKNPDHAEELAQAMNGAAQLIN